MRGRGVEVSKTLFYGLSSKCFDRYGIAAILQSMTQIAMMF